MRKSGFVFIGRLFEGAARLAGDETVGHPVRQAREEPVHEHGRAAQQGQDDLRAAMTQRAGEVLRAVLRAHQLALVERRLALGGAVGGEGRVADVGRSIARREHEDVESVLEVFDTDRVQEAADGVFRGAVAGPRRQRGIAGDGCTSYC